MSMSAMSPIATRKQAVWEGTTGSTIHQTRSQANCEPAIQLFTCGSAPPKLATPLKGTRFDHHDGADVIGRHMIDTAGRKKQQQAHSRHHHTCIARTRSQAACMYALPAAAPYAAPPPGHTNIESRLLRPTARASAATQSRALRRTILTPP
eukprot:GHVU01131956.1.p3 GENE.GHVU01131956.1~~GHVU01131956.1.p3  ORF type:complete len:151 (-),score=16.57 GHVU01131956.1:850-1302(-)